MSWDGQHPRISKKTVRSLAPPAACKECVYFLRLVDPARPYSVLYPTNCKCPRCGIPRIDVMNAIIMALCPKAESTH
jgi:hypothetical protein